MSMWKWVVTGGLAAAAFGVAAYALLPGTSPAPEPQRGYVERLELCVTSFAVASQSQLSEPASECFATVLAEAALAGKIPDIEPALRSLDVEAPMLCHTPAHYAGAIVFEDPDRWLELVDKIDTTVCTSGLLHGAIEQLARLNWSLDEWAPVIEWCQSASKRDPSPECAHAIGHAVWDTYEDRASSAAVCAKFMWALWEAFCAEGVVMQEFRPPGRPSEHVVLDRSADVTGVCAHSATEGSQYVTLGCLEGVGFVLSREFQSSLERAGPSGWTMRNLRSEVFATADACAQFGKDSHWCLGKFFFMVGFELYPMVQPSDFCSRLDEFEDLCMREMEEAVSVVKSGGEFTGSWDPPAPG